MNTTDQYTAPAQILLVDQHPLLRFGLTNLIEHSPKFEICGFADNPDTALMGLGALHPDLLLLDASLQSEAILELIKGASQLYPELPVLLVSMPADNRYAERMLRTGAQVYLTKTESTPAILAAIAGALHGKKYTSKDARRRPQRNQATGCDNEKFGVDSLSDRELEIFELIGRGRSSRDIADSLLLSIKTVETHRSHIKQKLKIKTATELAHRAFHWVESSQHFN